MMRRLHAVPACLGARLDAVLDKLMDDYEAGKIPEWGLDDAPGYILLEITKPEPVPAPLQLVRAS